MTENIFRVGVTGDSHGHTPSLEAVSECLHGVDLLIHAGDLYKDSIRLAHLTGIPVIGVVGNCDRERAPSDEIIDICGRRFFITHGHHYGVKTSSEGIIKEGLRRRAHVVIFGHTHVPIKFFHQGILFINPGSAFAGRRGHGKSCALITLTPDVVNVDFLSLPILRH